MPSDEQIAEAREWFARTSTPQPHTRYGQVLNTYIDELTAALRETTPWVENDYDARSIAENNRRLLAQWAEG